MMQSSSAATNRPFGRMYPPETIQARSPGPRVQSGSIGRDRDRVVGHPQEHAKTCSNRKNERTHKEGNPIARHLHPLAQRSTGAGRCQTLPACRR
jgi:hypothetical protein